MFISTRRAWALGSDWPRRSGAPRGLALYDHLHPRRTSWSEHGPPPSPTQRAGRRLLPRQGARAPARPSSRPRALDTVPSTNKQSRALWPDPVLAAPTAGICFSFLAAGEGVKCLHDDSGSRSHRHRGQQGCSHKPPWVATRTSPAFSINLRPRAGHESPSER